MNISLVEVPGCEAYREYLFTFMREQPIWLCLRFWNTAFFDAMQTERDHRIMANQKKQERRKAKQKAKAELADEQQQQQQNQNQSQNTDLIKDDRNQNHDIKNDISTSSSSHHSHDHGHVNKIKKDRSPKNTNETAADVDKEMEYIAFRQLT